MADVPALDYFAAQALQALVVRGPIAPDSTCRILGIERLTYDEAIHWPKAAALKAYDFAEAMVAESASRAMPPT